MEVRPDEIQRSTAAYRCSQFTMSAQTYYEILGLRDDADAEVIKASYRALIRKYHPDVAGDAGADITGRLNLAYDVLSNPSDRRDYDRTLAANAPPEAKPSAPKPSTPPSYATPPRRRTDPEPPDLGTYSNVRDAFERFESSKPWTRTRFRFWLWSWVGAVATLALASVFLIWGAFMDPNATLPLRGLPIPLVALALIVAVLPSPPIWPKVALLLLAVVTGLAALGTGQLSGLVDAVGYPAMIASALLGPSVLILRVTGVRALELWRVRPTAP